MLLWMVFCRKLFSNLEEIDAVLQMVLITLVKWIMRHMVSFDLGLQLTIIFVVSYYLYIRFFFFPQVVHLSHFSF